MRCEGAESDNHENAGANLSQLDACLTYVDCEGSPLHEDEGKDGNEVLSDYRCEREVELSPHVVVLMHPEISLPWVVVHGAEGVVQVRPGNGCHRSENVAHVDCEAHEAE